jgi:hypothetical protein
VLPTTFAKGKTGIGVPGKENWQVKIPLCWSTPLGVWTGVDPTGLIPNAFRISSSIDVKVAPVSIRASPDIGEGIGWPMLWKYVARIALMEISIWSDGPLTCN